MPLTAMTDLWCVSLDPASRGDDLLKAHAPGDARRPPTGRNLSSWPEGPCPAPSRGSISAAGALPRLFNQRERHAGRRAIGGQPVRLSANSRRPERRSSDGQMILTGAPAGRKPRRDLLVCGAPLRNRTVDLLLTIWTFLGSLPTLRPLGQQQPPTRPVRDLRPVGKTCRLREATRVSPDPANGRDHGHPACYSGSSVRLSPARPRPGRRSDDGQTILLPVWHDQKCLAEQALPLTASRIRTPAPLRAFR
jgi:hypothetical protein